MPLAIEITVARDLNGEHEVGGQDVPWEYTATVNGGSADDAVALMDSGFGAFRRAEAFNVCALSANSVSFLSFVMLEERRFEWSGSIESEARQAAVDGKVFHCIKRLHHAAVMAAVPQKSWFSRVRWWDHAHADPDLAELRDRNGRAITPGVYCRFNTIVGERVRVGTGWVAEITSHSDRPVVLYEDDEPQLMFRLVVRPGDVAILTDTDEWDAIKSLAGSTRFPTEANDWIQHCLASLPASGSDYMDADERARWAIQHAALKAKYGALSGLWA